MTDNLRRKCVKCGLSPNADDPNIKLHRFPKPGSTNMRRCEMWAKYCFPDKLWSSIDFQRKLYSEHRMLCNKHFKDSEFINIKEKKLSKHAVPDMIEFDEEIDAPPMTKLCNENIQVSKCQDDLFASPQTTSQENREDPHIMSNMLASLDNTFESSVSDSAEMQACAYASSLERSEMSDLLPTETISTPLPTLFCICCLQEEVPFISLLRCTHAEFLHSLMMPEIKPNDRVVCYQCHGMLKKIKLFKLQVEESFKLLSDSRKENTPKRSNQKQKLTIHETLNLHIPETSNKDNLKTIDNTEESLAKSSQNKERKTKNIEEALKIINGNQNNGYLNILTSSLQSISQTLISDIYTEFQLNKTDSIPIKLDAKTSSNRAISTENITKNDTGVENIQNDMNSKNVETQIGNKEKYQQVIEKDNSIDISESNMQIDSKNAHFGDTPSLGSNFEQLKLTKEELVQERARLASSPGYVRARHRCKSCLIGFQYKENFADHVQRKHTSKNKQSVLKCKVCRQFVRREFYDIHTCLHYNRYKCVSCGQQFGSFDSAASHYIKQHCNISTGNTELKCPHCPYKTLRKRILKNHLLVCNAS